MKIACNFKRIKNAMYIKLKSYHVEKLLRLKQYCHFRNVFPINSFQYFFRFALRLSESINNKVKQGSNFVFHPFPILQSS